MVHAVKAMRWYRVTPDRLIVGLLVIEGLLWLTNQLPWPIWHKGYAVLAALVVIGVFLLAMPVSWALCLAFGWRFQFSLRSLLTLTLAVALACGWLSWEVKKAGEQRDAIRAFRKVGGRALYDDRWEARFGMVVNSPLSPPAWLCEQFGNDFFGDVREVIAWSDKALAQIGRFPDVESVDFLCGIGVSSAGIAHLKQIPKLRNLRFGDGQTVTDEGLANLRFLPQLRRLDMGSSCLTDHDLECIGSLRQLEWLRLGGHFTDTGLARLHGLTRLKSLDLSPAEVTDQSVRRLQRALPNCKIAR
jgi:hypothetical protein